MGTVTSCSGKIMETEFKTISSISGIWWSRHFYQAQKCLTDQQGHTNLVVPWRGSGTHCLPVGPGAQPPENFGF